MSGRVARSLRKKPFSASPAFTALCAGLVNVFLKPGLPTATAAGRTLDLPVLAMETDPGVTSEAFLTQARAAIERGAEAIVLGCAGMSYLDDYLRGALEVPVIDGVALPGQSHPVMSPIDGAVIGTTAALAFDGATALPVAVGSA